jgi:protein-S-isoprenylcysteine O-methyltransferase Ste14
MMRTPTAALGSVVFFIAAPGTVAGLIPWLITNWEFHQPLTHWMVAKVIGALLICLGVLPLVSAFTEFVKAGGTPMPIAPPPQLVVSGFNRYVRNPMYVGVLLTIIGQALLFGRLALLTYAALTWLLVATFVRWYEEPTLTRQFGTDYQEYRRGVPAWWPRLRPWTPETTRSPG